MWWGGSENKKKRKNSNKLVTTGTSYYQSAAKVVTFTGLSFGRPCGKRVFSSCKASNILCLASSGRRSEGIDIISLLRAAIRGN